MTSDEALIKRTPLIYARSRNTGQLSSRLVAPQHSEVQLSGWPEVSDRTLRTIGMCSFNLGDYADAVWNLERARAETRKPLTEEQQKHVLDLIAKSNQHIGRFRVHLDPPEASLLVDGRAPLLLDQTELLAEAGSHDIEGCAAPSKVVGLSPQRVSLVLQGEEQSAPRG